MHSKKQTPSFFLETFMTRNPLISQQKRRSLFGD